MTRLICLAFAGAALGACGDNGENRPPDAPPTPDAAPDASNAFVPPTPFAVRLSTAGPDQLQSAVTGPDGTFYAAGFAAQALTGPKNVIVVKLSATGTLVNGFGTGGIATTPVVSANGTASEIQIAVQPSGKLIVIATVENAANTADRDIAVVRLDAAGAVDTAFGDTGDNGIQIVDLNTAIDPAANNGAQRDVSRGVAIAADGTIYIQGASKNPIADATDSDFTVAKLSVDGVRDMAFGGGDGKLTVDIKAPADPAGSAATPRGLKVLPDGNILAGGYASTTISGNTPQPVLYKLTPAGELVTGFAEQGVFHDIVVAAQTEIYNFAVHGNFIVTAGYGRAAVPANNDYISLRFNTDTGARDTAWGGAPNGAVIFDPSGAMLGSNCRNAVGLPGGKTLLIGSTGPANMPAQDAVFAVLDATGRLDPMYNAAPHKFPLGANLNDQFWGGAVSGNNVLVVGYKGGGPTPSDTVNDDAYGAVFALR